MFSLAACSTFFILVAMKEKEMNHKVPPGFRFQPNEEELINHYLKRKVLGLDSEGVQPIAEVNVLKFEPCDLPELSAIKSNDPFWYFFSQLDYKYLNRKRFRRTTEAGYWKLTGKDHEVRSRETKELIGFKKILVFVSKKARNHSTKWVIHEYHATGDFPNPNNYVICRLEKKGDGKANTSTHVEGESSGHVAKNIVHEGEGACPVDIPSQADTEEVNCYDELLFAEQRPSYQDPTLSNGLISDYNGAQPQFGTTEPKEGFALLDSNLNNECETYPVEANSHENLVIESEGLDCDVVGMSSAQPLKSISELSHIEKGGMSSDSNNEVAIAQVREATEHVTANGHEVEFEWGSFFDIPGYTKIEPYFGYTTVEPYLDAPQLSHNFNEIDYSRL